MFRAGLLLIMRRINSV